jgi:DHA2 family multidrug resistance protein
MGLSGRLVGKVSFRLLVIAGFLIGAYAVYDMIFWTPDVSEGAIIYIGFLQGFSVGMVTIPLTVTAFSTLPAEMRTEAAGVYSLMRNLGSAIGISVTGALLLTNTIANHAAIASAITRFNRVFQTGGALRVWNPLSATGATALDGEITRQAAVIAYSDDFKLLFVLSMLSLPFVFLIRAGQEPTTAPGVRGAQPLLPE